MSNILKFNNEKTPLELLKQLVEEGQVEHLVISFTKKGSTECSSGWYCDKNGNLWFMVSSLYQAIHKAIWG